MVAMNTPSTSTNTTEMESSLLQRQLQSSKERTTAHLTKSYKRVLKKNKKNRRVKKLPSDTDSGMVAIILVCLKS